MRGIGGRVQRYNDDGPGFFGYLVRLILIIVLVGTIGLVAYAYFGDLTQAPAPQTVPVPLNEG